MATKLLLHMDGDQSTSVSGVDGYTKLLLHMDDAWLTDSSLYNHTTTKNSSADRSASESKFGGYSMYSPGTGANDYLEVPDSDDWAFGNGDFTIDCWVNQTTVTDDASFVHRFQSGAPFFWTFGMSGTTNLRFNVYQGGYVMDVSAAYSFSPGTWYHVAVVRNGSDLRLYVNGSSIASSNVGTTSIPTFTIPLRIGSNPVNVKNFLGYIDEVRISKGIARWTSNFTPATLAYSGAHNITVNGNPKLDTSTKKFGSSSMYFDGSGDYLTIPNSSDFDFGTGDFTIDCWCYFTDYAGVADNGGNIVGQFVDNSNRWMFAVMNDGRLRLYALSSGIDIDFIGTTPVGLDAWHHLAAVRNGNDFTIYVDGVLYKTGTNTDSMPNLNSELLIVKYSHGVGDYFQGYMDELRISKGVARWTSDFSGSLPSSEYTTDANTKLLLHFNSDVSGSGHEVTFNGDPQIAVTPTKWNGSYYFDGAGDYLSVADHDDWDFGTGDFTIDCWIRTPSISEQSIYSHPTGTDGYNGAILRLMLNGSLNFTIYVGNSAVVTFASSASCFVADTWYHVALVRNGDVWSLYQDGTSIASTTNSYTYPNFTNTFFIGYRVPNMGGGSWNGYIDEFRVSNEALWTENFSVPSSPGVVDFYRLSGNLSDEVRILALNESSWAITENTTASGSGWSIDFDNDEAHTIIARKSDGESQGYGDMSPALV